MVKYEHIRYGTIEGTLNLPGEVPYLSVVDNDVFFQRVTQASSEKKETKVLLSGVDPEAFRLLADAQPLSYRRLVEDKPIKLGFKLYNRFLNTFVGYPISSIRGLLLLYFRIELKVVCDDPFKCHLVVFEILDFFL